MASGRDGSMHDAPQTVIVLQTSKMMYSTQTEIVEFSVFYGIALTSDSDHGD
jgi:hypothetical protein